ncbi:MAG: hypothetical protein GYA21_18680 [Myxococcales bacterium]|nr:hypothetical protein [Myxococcales bacterium]
MHRAVIAILLSLGSAAGCALTLEDLQRRGERREFGELRAIATDRARPGWAREEAVAVLGRKQAEEAAPDLVAILLDARESPWLRAAAAEALGNLRRPGCVETLEPLVQQTDLFEEIRVAALRSLCACGGADERVRQALADLSQDPDLLVAALADSLRRGRCAP